MLSKSRLKRLKSINDSSKTFDDLFVYKVTCLQTSVKFSASWDLRSVGWGLRSLIKRGKLRLRSLL